MVKLKIETKTDSYEGAVILIKEALRQIREGSQAGVIGGGIGECIFDVDLSAAQQPRALDEANEPLCVCGKPISRHNGVACLPESPRQ